VKRLCIICEGIIEKEFIRDCLALHLFCKGVFAEPILIGKKINVARIAHHIRNTYRCFDYVTTLVDYYGFGDWQGRDKIQLENAILERVETLIEEFDRYRVIPYVQMHEFEALLFSDIEEFKWVLDGWNPKARQKLLAIRNDFNTPEDINNDPNTAPSKRLQDIFPGYDDIKAEYGPIIASEIGLPKIRQECPSFDAWLTRLEHLGQE
jgi:hypothetical protein